MDPTLTWDIKNKEFLKKIQTELSKKYKEIPLNLENLNVIGGFDSLRCKNNETIGNLTFFDYETNVIIDSLTISTSKIPKLNYETGYLSLIEIPIFYELWRKKKCDPDLIVVDGNGILHQRKCGLATHLSFLTSKPTFGIAKNLVGGNHKSVKLTKGEFEPIIWNDEILGLALCTKDGSKPVFVSVGNLISLDQCKDIALKFSKYRIPELTRQPDLRTKEICRNVITSLVDL